MVVSQMTAPEKTVLEQAKKVLGTNPPARFKDVAELIRDLLAEARGLEDRVTQLKMDCDQQHKHAMEWQEEAAKWWQIAIEKGAIIKFLQEAHSTKIQLRAAKAQMKHWDQLPDVFKDSWRKSAARELETASSDHIFPNSSILLTPERRTALEYAIFAIEQLGSDPEVLRGMLKEAEGE